MINLHKGMADTGIQAAHVGIALLPDFPVPGLPMALLLIGWDIRRARPAVERYRAFAEGAGHPDERLTRRVRIEWMCGIVPCDAAHSRTMSLCQPEDAGQRAGMTIFGDAHAGRERLSVE
ncbi:hypothetical protein ACH40E_39880 [Streptomyces acidicola]|uniref:hypothetical protein n=1 Tax=Streptomyces acidicola TaxID=2596892 RepID=UPI0037894867